jgi:hypothetical protein
LFVFGRLHLKQSVSTGSSAMYCPKRESGTTLIAEQFNVLHCTAARQ